MRMLELIPPATQHQRLRLTASSAYASPATTDTASSGVVARIPSMYVSNIVDLHCRQRAEHFHDKDGFVILDERLADLTHQHLEHVLKAPEYLGTHAVGDHLEARIGIQT